MMQIDIRELTSEAQLQAIYPLILQLNPGMEESEFASLLSRMLPLGYRCLAAYEGAEIVGICGIWTRVQFWNKLSLQVDNIVVLPEKRSANIGKMLMDRVEAMGREMGARMLVLDSYTYNHPSHRFYFREGYVILGYHFTKEL